jgi:hypothetical protein
MSRNLVRFGGIAGVIFAVLIAIGAFATGGPPPDISAAGSDVIRYYSSSAGKLAYTVGGALPTPFAAFFFATVTLRLWGRVADRGWLLIAFSASAITGAVATAGNIVVWGPLAYGSLDAATAHGLNAALATGHVGVGLMILTTVLAYGVVQSRIAGFPRWLGYLGLLTAVLEAVSFLSSVSNGAPGIVGFVALLAFLLWSLLTGAEQAAKGEATT